MLLRTNNAFISYIKINLFLQYSLYHCLQGMLLPSCCFSKQVINPRLKFILPSRCFSGNNYFCSPWRLLATCVLHSRNLCNAALWNLICIICTSSSSLTKYLYKTANIYPLCKLRNFLFFETWYSSSAVYRERTTACQLEQWFRDTFLIYQRSTLFANHRYAYTCCVYMYIHAAYTCIHSIYRTSLYISISMRSITFAYSPQSVV